MEALPCANEVAQLQEQQLRQHQHQPPSSQLEAQHSQSPVPLNEAQQLVNLSSLNATMSMGENVVNIPKELILITLVSQEQALYNPKHQHYRSPQRKDEKWSEIGSHVGWTDTQCKAKWKAMRDQYCRELKRAKASAKTNVKWKYFKELDFLRPYALARNYRSRTSNGNVCTATVALASVTTTLTNNNNNNSFSSNSNSQTLALAGDPHKFGNIKIEDASASLLDNCNFVPSTTDAAAAATTATVVDKKSDSTRLISAFIAGQISNVMQQQAPQQHQDNNWNYLSDGNANGVANATAITVTRETPNTTTDDTFYNDFVDCVSAAAANNHTTADEEDDDPIHTFLNMESYFEKELIMLIQQEDMIYNYSNQNYRNVKLKLEVWDEIARKLKKPVKQCRQKWKALRDQYAREHKRLKIHMHLDAHSRWKHYDSLNFLHKYIQQKSLDGNDQLSLLLPKHEPVAELDEQMRSQSPLRSEPQQTLATSPAAAQLNIPALPPLTGPHKAELPNELQQQQHDQDAELCVTGYDEMDIENYINGDAAHDEEDDEEEDEEMEADVTEQQQQQQQQTQQQQQQHVVSYQNNDEHVYIASVGNALVNSAKSQQQSTSEHVNEATNNLEQQQQQQQQQQPHQLQTAADYQQKLDVHTPTSSASRYHNAVTPTTSHAAFSLSANDDDEIGAFFKAVGMKIRNAQLEPVAFTDLQIEILRVINEALRHH